MIEIIADASNYVGEAIYGTIGAIIGTFGGSWITYRFGQRHVHSVRKIAISALKDMKKFAKKNNTYKTIEPIFNNINEARKRAILTALYKVGIPIAIPEDGNLNIADIHFNDEVIDANYLDDVIININLGHCDKYFYEDISSCIASDFRIKAIRKIGVKYVTEVLSRSRAENNQVQRPDNWMSLFTYGELQTIAVLAENLLDVSYFDRGVPKKQEMEKIISEINKGIWDMHLQWNYTAHSNMKLQKENMLLQNIVVREMLCRMQNSNQGNETQHTIDSKEQQQTSTENKN